MVLYSISVVAIIAIMIAAMILLWKICRWILIPLQIALFLSLLFVGYKFLMEYGEKNPTVGRYTHEVKVIQDKLVQNAVEQVKGTALLYKE